jgi:hypothetical protein
VCCCFLIGEVTKKVRLDENKNKNKNKSMNLSKLSKLSIPNCLAIGYLHNFSQKIQNILLKKRKKKKLTNGKKFNIVYLDVINVLSQRE